MLLRRITRHCRARIRLWQNRRFLTSHNCQSWREYRRKFDPGINRRARLVRDYFCGYAYIHCIESYQHHAYQYDRWGLHPDSFRAGYQDLDDWCYRNCQARYNYQVLRVIQNHWGAEWECNELGGGDYVFFAFESPEDYVIFCLRWG